LGALVGAGLNRLESGAGRCQHQHVLITLWLLCCSRCCR
jgi:hypothetical protein